MANGFWEIPNIWDGDCFVLGGGVSLKEIPKDKLCGKHVIGCNDSYLLTAKICDFVCFGDYGWSLIHKDHLSDYKSLFVTNIPERNKVTQKNVRLCKRTEVFLSEESHKLSWFDNTGCVAIELAMKLGATRIIMLGFDMQLTNGQANWYRNMKDKPNKAVYPKFVRGFVNFEKQQKRKFPNVEIINANLKSQLNVFPKIDWKEVL